MLEQSDTNISTVLDIFSRYGVEVSLLVPTQTGMNKSIMDAVSPLRRSLREKNIHDYEQQGQGQGYKKMVPGFIVGASELIETRVSLYRPLTKQGDPRIWVYGLNNYAAANNLLVILCHNGQIFVINASRREILQTIDTLGSPLYTLLNDIANADRSPASIELLDRLREVSSKGYIKSDYHGDTAVGIMLNQELGIPRYDMNRGPDFRGIEIKAHRKTRRQGRNSRGTLFSQVPNWEISRLGSSREILSEYGYWSDEKQRRQLYVTVTAKAPNAQGLYFEVDEENDLLKNLARREDPDRIEDVVTWTLQVLRDRILDKHRETFFVGAEVQVERQTEFFHYVVARYTRRPLIQNLEYLLDQGILTMDFTINEKPNGEARDHGYLFKMWSKELHLLLPTVAEYDLTI